MRLIDAVNTVLPYLGEHVITRIEGTKHPTVGLITDAIERQTRSLLAQGFWFNELELTLPLNTDGYVRVPERTISAQGLNCNLVIDGEFFMNAQTGSNVFTQPVVARILRDYEFEKLPELAALVVTYKAAIEVFTADYGADNTLQVLQQHVYENMALLRQEELRMRRYNTQPNIRRKFGRYNSIMRFR